MSIALKKFIARFVEEARANIQAFEDGLSQLQSSADDKELINSLFRAIHTIKGSSRMLKLTNITDGAHKTEDVLDALRSGEICYTQNIGLVLHSASDMITGQIDEVDESGRSIRAGSRDNEGAGRDTQRSITGRGKQQHRECCSVSCSTRK